MSGFNLDSLSCETLRRRLSSNNANILRDQSLRDSLNAQIRHVEILLADKKFELGQVGKPPLPGFPDPDSRRRDKRPRAGLPGLAITAAELAAAPVENERERRRIRRDIREFEGRLERLKAARFERQARLNEAIAGRALVIEALDNKRC